MTPTELKTKIQSAIQSMKAPDLSSSALELFSALGYNTDRRAPFAEKTFQFFKDSFLDGQTRFNEEKALVPEWKSVDLLFQLSKEEISPNQTLFNTNRVDNTIIETYLFFAIDLTAPEYSRSALAGITREINRVFPMPVMVIFRHGDNVTISVVNRRLHKRNEQQDVLEKVTLIKDISLITPHRAHIEIIFDLSFAELQRIHQFTNFVELHNAWQATLDTKELNKRFYSELSNWYFWAMREVTFPNPTCTSHMNTSKPEQTSREHNAKNLIRLLTRILFVWFVKEKNLIPEELFDEKYIGTRLIHGFQPNLSKQSATVQNDRYYRAILQNLFFATLNQDVGKRDFHRSGQDGDPNNLMRYESYFKDPKLFIKLLESIVPFMNGGLFECLDKTHHDNQTDFTIYHDGFSDSTDNKLYVPDYVFFGSDQQVDLSDELGDKKQKNVTVRGLVKILKSYKFTVAENTPIEEDIALDPELLGRVFENLLASYNPETKTTARKQTGSFYTPREIVNYMVDESLKAYLIDKLVSGSGMLQDDAEIGIDLLLGYNEEDHLFDEKQTMALIRAVDSCKILDPACGSGAFPMGMLHKLVYVLHKLDPQNKLWKDSQIKKAMTIDDPSIREQIIQDIETAFTNNELDYGRKLYLIENCIYGLDIQPIAIQISKLRFFISLIVDQKSDKSQDNFGVRPLPNLETKFVAANTLIEIAKSQSQQLLFNQELNDLEHDLREIRHRLFNAKTQTTKGKLRTEDQLLRKKIGAILLQSGCDKEWARQLSTWDPYDQNATNPFFDPEWMFGISEGFDLVIGNPPYVQLQKDGGALAKQYTNTGYKCFERTGDIYALFYEKGLSLLRANGHLCFISSNKWMRAVYGKSLRECFLKHNPKVLIDLGPGIFENAAVDTNILLIQNAANRFAVRGASLSDSKIEDNIGLLLTEKAVPLSGLSQHAWFIAENHEQNLKQKLEDIGRPLNQSGLPIYSGVKTGLNQAFIIDQKTYESIFYRDPDSHKLLKPLLRGRDINRYCYKWENLWLINTAFDLDISRTNPVILEHLTPFKSKASSRGDKGLNWWNLRPCSYYPEFEQNKIVWSDISVEPTFAWVDPGIYFNNTVYMICGGNKALLGVLNSRVTKWLFPRIASNLGQSGSRYFKQFVGLLPVPKILSKQDHLANEIEVIVDKILNLKKDSHRSDTRSLERQIDQIVYQLYELNPQEIKIIEDSTECNG